MPTFDPARKNELAAEIQGLIGDAVRNVGINRSYDIGFKVALLFLTICVTFCSVLLTSYEGKPPKPLALTNAILAGLSTALSTFAFTQFNFANRQRQWQRKADGYAGLKAVLIYSDPESDWFLQRLLEIRGLSEDTPTDVHLDRVTPPGARTEEHPDRG